MVKSSLTDSKIIEPTHIEEPWTIIHLPNGDKIKVKTVIIAVYQMLDDKGDPARLEDNSGPMYAVNHQLVIAVEEKSSGKISSKGLN